MIQQQTFIVAFADMFIFHNLCQYTSVPLRCKHRGIYPPPIRIFRLENSGGRSENRGRPESVFLPENVLQSGGRRPPDTENFRKIAHQTSGFCRNRRIAGEKRHRE